QKHANSTGKGETWRKVGQRRRRPLWWRAAFTVATTWSHGKRRPTRRNLNEFSRDLQFWSLLPFVQLRSGKYKGTLEMAHFDGPNCQDVHQRAPALESHPDNQALSFHTLPCHLSPQEGMDAKVADDDATKKQPDTDHSSDGKPPAFATATAR